MPELKHLRNVGKATLEDLDVLGISSVAELAECDPTELFERLQRETGQQLECKMQEDLRAGRSGAGAGPARGARTTA